MGRSLRSRRLGMHACLATLLLIAFGIWHAPTPLYIVSGGPVVPVDDLLEIEGDPIADVENGIRWYLTSIAVEPATVGSLLKAWPSSERDVMLRERIVPAGHDLESFWQMHQRLMLESRMVAAHVSYRRSGYRSRLEGEGAEVLAVWPGSPFFGAGIRRGDVLLAVEETSIRLADDLVTALTILGKQRQELRLTFRRGKDIAATVLRLPADELRAFPTVPEALGAMVATYELQGEFHPPVEFLESSIGGPSAGLAFALYVEDRLGGWSLPESHPAHPWRVAATGRVRVDESITPVSGVGQKARALERAGVDVFLVPIANAAEAENAGTGLDIVPAATVGEAVEGLTEIFSRRYNDAVSGGGDRANPGGFHSRAAGGSSGTEFQLGSRAS